MTELLARIFIKNYKDYKDQEVRVRYGIFSGIVGIICNVILCIAKIVAGIVTSSVSIMADGINNLSDAGSSIVTLIGFKLAGKPADYEHPYGHGRIEYIAGFIVSGIIMLMGAELFTSSIKKIIHPTAIEFSTVSIGILIFSICLKLWMGNFNKSLGQKLKSETLLATSTDSFSDVIATTMVLFSVLLSLFSDLNIDGYAGTIVAVFVFIAGFKSARDTLRPLLGEPPSREYVQQLQELILKDDHILGVHDLIVHNYGPGRVYASVHAEVPAEMSMLEAHEYIDMAERRVRKRMNCFITIHMDPIITDDEQIQKLRSMTEEVVKEVGEEISIHDFRTVSGPYTTNLIFDILVPYDYRKPDEDIVYEIKKKITERRSNCRAVIEVDKGYI